MTPTAIELWNDAKFIEKRCYEQLMYIIDLHKSKHAGHIRMERFIELSESAKEVENRFFDRYEQLTNDK